MTSYADNKIIECARLHSEEAKGDPLRDENNSLWTNNLQDIIHLEPGDEVSVYGSFISERGAGQPTSIEVKGHDLGTTQTFNYIVMNGSGALPTNTSQFKQISADYTTETFNLRDDTGRFTISYYMPANAHNCVQLPRRFMYAVAGTTRLNWEQVDSPGGGMTLWRPEKGGFYLPDNFYRTLKNATSEGGERLLKQKQDNSRYSILVRDMTYFDKTTAEGNLEPQDLRDPEYDPGNNIKPATYRLYKELKEVVVPPGFNSAEFLATEITRQIQNITDKSIFKVPTTTNSGYYPISAIKTMTSETYKPFMAGNVMDNSALNFMEYFNLSAITGVATRPGWTNGSGSDWLRQYQFVGCKYPELFETGRLINRDSLGVYKGSKGIETKNIIYETDNEGWALDITYDELMATQFKNFFDAQTLYPEIIESLNNVDSGYNVGNDLTNTRFIHMNRFTNASQSISGNDIDAQLGFGAYHNPRTWTPSATQQLCSLLMCLYFDPAQKDIFYKRPDEKLNQYTYGCLGRTDDGYIKIYPNKHINNGFNTPLYNEVFIDTGLGVPGEKTIEFQRRIGFDMHFTAPGMSYLLPLSGWTVHSNDKLSHAGSVGNFIIQDNQNSGTITAGSVDINVDKNQLYLGADNPRLSFDGTHFSFAGLHTSMNRGNTWDAGSPVIANITPATAPQPDSEAGDQVYKVNPQDHFIDFTPDRTPYSYPLTTYDYSGVTELSIPKFNTNLEAWKIYDYLSGIFIEDFNISDTNWENSLWGLLGFTYKQFHSTTNNRQVRVQFGNANDLSKPTTNAEVIEGDTKIYITNAWGVPMYNNMVPSVYNIFGHAKTTGTTNSHNSVYPEIIHKTESISIIADNLPTRMIRGYYTIRSNLLEENPFIGGKVNNTQMPIIGIVDKINGDGDFYFGQESSLVFTITKPLRIASLSVSIHDPDGSYARTSSQSTILFQVKKMRETQFNQVEQLLQQTKKK